MSSTERCPFKDLFAELSQNMGLNVTLTGIVSQIDSIQIEVPFITAVGLSGMSGLVRVEPEGRRLGAQTASKSQ